MINLQTLNTTSSTVRIGAGLYSSLNAGSHLSSNVSIHNRALTPPEIQELYRNPLAMIDTGVELWSPELQTENVGAKMSGFLM